jgi:hypothetical protein
MVAQLVERKRFLIGGPDSGICLFDLTQIAARQKGRNFRFTIIMAKQKKGTFPASAQTNHHRQVTADTQWPTTSNATNHYPHGPTRREAIRGITGEQRDCNSYCEEGSRSQSSWQEVENTDIKAKERTYGSENDQGGC